MALISHKLAQPAFVVYLLLAIAAVGFLIFYAAPRWGDSNVLVYVLICALTGSLNVMAAKGFGVAVRNTFAGEGDNLAFSNGLTFVFLANTIVCSAVQMVYLNRALRAHRASLVSPIYYVAFTSFVTIAAAILYGEFDRMEWWNVVGLVAGIIVAFFAVCMLVFFKVRKGEDRTLLADRTLGGPTYYFNRTWTSRFVTSSTRSFRVQGLEVI